MYSFNIYNNMFIIIFIINILLLPEKSFRSFIKKFEVWRFYEKELSNQKNDRIVKKVVVCNLYNCYLKKIIEVEIGQLYEIV